MHLHRNSILMLAAVALAAIGLAACGGSSSSDSPSSSTGANKTATGGATVSTKTVGGVGTALVDATGDVLYTNDMDSGSKIACTGECTGIWMPLAAPSSGKPTAEESAVQSKLGVVKTPDGTNQVTYGGKPLYTFVQDSPGQAGGNGVTDSFNGTSFTWSAATTSGGSTGSAGSTTSGTAGGYSGGY